MHFQSETVFNSKFIDLERKYQVSKLRLYWLMMVRSEYIIKVGFEIYCRLVSSDCPGEFDTIIRPELDMDLCGEKAHERNDRKSGSETQVANDHFHSHCTPFFTQTSNCSRRQYNSKVHEIKILYQEIWILSLSVGLCLKDEFAVFSKTESSRKTLTLLTVQTSKCYTLKQNSSFCLASHITFLIISLVVWYFIQFIVTVFK